jgi:hypothetical protein
MFLDIRYVYPGRIVEINVFGYLTDAEAGCNWYLHDINIFSLLKHI